MNTSLRLSRNLFHPLILGLTIAAGASSGCALYDAFGGSTGGEPQDAFGNLEDDFDAQDTQDAQDVRDRWDTLNDTRITPDTPIEGDTQPPFDVLVAPDAESPPDTVDGGTDTAAEAGPSCTDTAVDFEVVQPNIYIIQDRTRDFDQTGNYNSLKVALNRAADKYSGRMNFGMSIFPVTGPLAGCGGSWGESLALGQHSAEAIKSSYASMGRVALVPMTSTATLIALDSVMSQTVYRHASDASVRYPKNIVVLISDDKAISCGNYIITDYLPHFNQDSSTSLAVIGYGADTSSMDNYESLSPQLSYYYPPDGTALFQALDEIIGSIVDCQIELQISEADRARLRVKVDGEQVQADEPDGYSLNIERGILTLRGDACDSLLELSPELDRGESVEISLACPNP
ncbi:hypothetical protein [Bradymonas sediminis]|uniref:Uncharacterized protein n=1 Tax=Bradymonas sediminis TaxID=1548548 RepID=A0A2Z4FIT7_9DELT|nr:hypothetical protein [Bradymonas sediminis]AWV88735.1 hypothetical protein DN745_05040 [Bradymonas sediminis]TDP63572.1 hypothetical protein DFR33_11029 [Bradymonas sediminis]